MRTTTPQPSCKGHAVPPVAPHLLGASLVVRSVVHGALVAELGHVVPPEPWLPALVGQLEHAQLPQVLLHSTE